MTATATQPTRETVRDLTRIMEWWASEVGLLLGVGYLQILLSRRSPGDAAVELVALLWSCILLASYANILNDLTDLEQDRAAGRSTGVMKVGRPVATVLTVTLAALGLLPWLVVPLSPAAWVALLGIVVLPLLYSLPGIRLKERGVLGVLTDAVFERTLPTVFVVLLFRGTGEQSLASDLVGLAIVPWAFAIGMRGIVGHQIMDEAADRAAGVGSWIQVVGSARARRLIRHRLFPVECASIAAAVAVLVVAEPVVGIGALVAAVLLAESRRTGVWTRPLHADPPTDDEGRWLLWKFYRLWPAALALVGLALDDPWFLALAAVHLLLFWTAVFDELSSARYYGPLLVAAWVEGLRIEWHAYREVSSRWTESFRLWRHHTYWRWRKACSSAWVRVKLTWFELGNKRRRATHRLRYDSRRIVRKGGRQVKRMLGRGATT